MNEQKTHSLLKELSQLYSKVTAITLRRRVSSYREEARGGNDALAAKLERRVESLEGSQAKQPVGTADAAALDAESVPENSRRSPKGSRLGRMLKDFSRYLTRKHKGHNLQPHLSKQLRDSAWDHLHSAIRLARQGDMVNAKLHKDIVLSALDELAHFMPEQEYQQFQAEIQQQIDQLDQPGS